MAKFDWGRALGTLGQSIQQEWLRKLQRQQQIEDIEAQRGFSREYLGLQQAGDLARMREEQGLIGSRRQEELEFMHPEVEGGGRLPIGTTPEMLAADMALKRAQAGYYDRSPQPHVGSSQVSSPLLYIPIPQEKRDRFGGQEVMPTTIRDAVTAQKLIYGPEPGTQEITALDQARNVETANQAIGQTAQTLIESLPGLQPVFHGAVSDSARAGRPVAAVARNLYAQFEQGLKEYQGGQAYMELIAEINKQINRQVNRKIPEKDRFFDYRKLSEIGKKWGLDQGQVVEIIRQQLDQARREQQGAAKQEEIDAILGGMQNLLSGGGQ